MRRSSINVPFTVTVHSASVLVHMSVFGIATLGKPTVPSVPVTSTVIVLAVALKLKLLSVELLTMSTL